MQVTVETNPASLFFDLVKDDWIQDGMEIRGGYKNEERERLPCLSFFGNAPAIELPSHGDWQLLGSPFSLTEEQWAKIVDYSDIAAMGVDDHQGGYKCYERNHWFHSTATEAGKSLLVANEIYQTNLIPKALPKNYPALTDGDLYLEHKEAYEYAQSRTGNWILLVNYKSIV